MMDSPNPYRLHNTVANIPSDGVSGVVGTLSVRRSLVSASAYTTSANAPPMSTPMSFLMCPASPACG